MDFTKSLSQSLCPLGASVSLSENFQMRPQGHEGCLREKPTDPRKREAHLAMLASLPPSAHLPPAQLPAPSLSLGWWPSGEAQRPGSGASCPQARLSGKRLEATDYPYHAPAKRGLQWSGGMGSASGRPWVGRGIGSDSRAQSVDEVGNTSEGRSVPGAPICPSPGFG